MAAAPPAQPPEYHQFGWGPSLPPALPGSPPRTQTTNLSPPLIAMVAVVGTAFLIVLYVRVLSRPLRRLRSRWQRWRRRRRLALSAATDPNYSSPAAGAGDYYYYSSGASSNYFLSPYGLDDAAIKALPISTYSRSKGKHLCRECAVCLLEFDDDDELRTLPLCSHAFHADCIDVWLRSHANCPLCRAAIFHQDISSSNNNNSSSPFIPMRAARIRPSFDDFLLNPHHLLPPPPAPTPPPPLEPDQSEIVPESPARVSREEGYEGRDFLLTRSYSFGFERNLAADRMMMESSTPWRYRHRSSFWSKRWPSPFVGGGGGGGGSSSSRATRVFSFRSYRGVNVRSPFQRRRGSFLPLSESRVGQASRRTRSLTSPVAFFSRTSAAAGSVAGFGSSRLRCGDPEALLSPERLNRR